MVGEGGRGKLQVLRELRAVSAAMGKEVGHNGQPLGVAQGGKHLRPVFQFLGHGEGSILEEDKISKVVEV